MTAGWAALAAVLLLAASGAATLNEHPVRSAMAGALCGLGALGAVNLLAGWTGVSLPMNCAAAYVSVVLGAPGVALMLALRMVLGA
ncbi:MAG: pro-sigmaK processing inhibitor BofA family protein [Oscillospiraceae bacterium]|nr:pro-sigmaK processing inhibitor BofA family protein [Oscillospiraceae bacterium]